MENKQKEKLLKIYHKALDENQEKIFREHLSCDGRKCDYKYNISNLGILGWPYFPDFENWLQGH